MDANKFTRARQLAPGFAQLPDRRASAATKGEAAPRLAGESLRLALARAIGTVLDRAPESLSRQRLEDIRGRLNRRIARERGRARCGSLSYDVNRHIALHRCLRALAAMLTETAKPGPKQEKAGANAGF
jgi:hypothetical protein